MLAGFELIEIDRLRNALDEERERMRTLIEMLGALGIRVWLDEAGEITIINEALEAPCPIGLGAGYMGLGAGGT